MLYLYIKILITKKPSWAKYINSNCKADFYIFIDLHIEYLNYDFRLERPNEQFFTEIFIYFMTYNSMNDQVYIWSNITSYLSYNYMKDIKQSNLNVYFLLRPDDIDY